MRILLRKIFERLILIIFALVLIIGNISVLYNISNKYYSINEKVNIYSFIQNSKYIEIKNVQSNNIVRILDNNKKEELFNCFNDIKVRENSIDIFDNLNNSKKYLFIIHIYYENNDDKYISISNRDIILDGVKYTTDMYTYNLFDKLFE